MLCESIAELKMAGKALRRSDDLYRNIFDNTGTAIILIEEDTVIRLMNAEAELLSGYSKEEIEGRKSWMEFVVGEDLEWMIQQHHLRREHPEDALTHYETRFLQRSGRIRNVCVTIRLIPGTKQSVASFHDLTERKKIEQALVEKDRFVESIVENIPDMVFIKDARELRFVRFNRAGEMLTGHSREEMIGKTDHDFFPNDQADFFTEVDRKVLLTKQVVDIAEELIQTRNGVRILHTKKIPVVDQEGTPLYLLGISEDITDRKRVVDALKRSEEKFSKAFHNSPAVVTVSTTEDGTFLEVNENFERLFGINRPEVIGKSAIDIGVWSNREDRDALVRRLVNGEPVHAQEINFVSKTTGLLTGLVSADLVDVDGQSCILMVAIDITDRKRAERALEESEKRYREFFEGDLTGAFLSTTGGSILDCNPAFMRIYGFGSLEQARQTNAVTLYPNPEARTALHERLRREKKLEFCEVECRRVDGQPLFLIENLVGIFNNRGEMSHIRGYIFNNTEHRQLKNQLYRAQKIESLGTLAAGIAHDFNNILNIIVGNAALLGNVPGDQMKQAQRIEAIKSVAERGSKVVKQLLTFARKKDLEQRPILINELIDEVAEFLQAILPKDIVVSLERAPELPFVVGDSNQLYQVLVNLCVNARDAMPDGGVLTVKSQSTRGDLVRQRFSKATARDYVSIVVADTGIGMDEGTRKRAFDPFFTTKEVGKGTGLGLSVVLGIVESHGGFVDVESQQGVGTQIVVHLPAPDQVKRGINPEGTTFLSLPGGSETILVVEDDSLGRQMIVEFLESQGYKVLSAADGEEAVKQFRRHSQEISLVVTDLGLPKCDGEEVCRRIQAINTSVPLIIASGFVDPERMEMLKEIGVKHVFSESYTLAELSSKIRNVLDKQEG